MVVETIPVTTPIASYHWNPQEPLNRVMLVADAYVNLIKGVRPFIIGSATPRIGLIMSGVNIMDADLTSEALHKTDTSKYALFGTIRLAIKAQVMALIESLWAVFDERASTTRPTPTRPIPVGSRNSKVISSYPAPTVLQALEDAFESVGGQVGRTFNEKLIETVRMFGIDCGRIAGTGGNNFVYPECYPRMKALYQRTMERLANFNVSVLDRADDYCEPAFWGLLQFWCYAVHMITGSYGTDYYQNLPMLYVKATEFPNISDTTLMCLPTPSLEMCEAFSEDKVYRSSQNARYYMNCLSYLYR